MRFLQAYRFFTSLACTVFVVGAFASSASAQSQCLKEAAGINSASCSANDVRFGIINVIDGPDGCVPGEQIDLTLQAEVIAGNADRYDIGFWVNSSDGLARTDPGTTDCVHTGLTIPPGVDLEGGGADVCGDIGDEQTIIVQFDVTVLCNDGDADDVADISACTSWDNQVDQNCSNPDTETIPGTGSKCNCNDDLRIPIGDIVVFETAEVTVTKDVEPNAAPGLFNLQIDSNTVDNANCTAPGVPFSCCTGAAVGTCSDASDIGDTGTTGAITVGAGTNVDPGAMHTVGETVGTGTSLSDYSSSILCTCDLAGGGCDASRGTNDVLCDETGASCDIDVLPDEVVNCVITNTLTNACVGSPDCSSFNTDCATASCDPTGTINNCDTLTPITGICRASAGECDAAEECDGVNTGACPADGFAAAGASCGESSDSDCDNPDSCDGSGNCVENNEPATTECRAAADDCDVAEFCDGNGGCPADDFVSAGTACGDQSDGLCDDPDTCDGAGNCESNNEPATVVCRADAGECDVAEFCDGVGNCPADQFESAGTACGNQSDGVCDNPDTCDDSGMCQNNNETTTVECRADAGDCDVPEFCDGNGECPADGFEDEGTACGSSSGDVCDAADTCDASGSCQPNNSSTDVICRPAAGECDVAEFCDGSGSCPDDDFESAGTSCGDDTDDVCDNPDTCDGSGGCQDNNEPATTECRADAGECDVAEFCDGAGSCPDDGFEPVGTSCGNDTDDVCNNPDTCDGSGGCQENNEPATTECRADAGDCDVAELCDGAGACPDDGFEPEGTSCGDQTDGLCDNPDTCDATGGCQDNFEAVTSECRADAGDCDVAEFCDGSGACPDDGFEDEGTACGNSSGDVCDAADTCDAAGNCEPNNSPTDVICRAAEGECDVAEFCDGQGGCPDDTFQPDGTSCGDDTDDVCDNPDTCDGSGSCQDNFETATTECRADAGDCDVAENCDGAGNCPDDGFESEGTACGDDSDTVCDNPDTCDGDGACEDNHEPATTECRADTGDCDMAELCDGEGNCPADGFEPFGTSCEDDGNVCTDDACDADGHCEHTPNTASCSDGEACTSGDQCVAGECMPGNASCDTLCRTPGFWGARGGSERGGQNITEEVISLAGGALNVCGQIITQAEEIGSLDSALEGLCVSVRREPQRQLYRQLVAFYLNCVISGAATDCDALVPIASECDLLCATGGSDAVTINECIGQIDCFNNGGEQVDGGCALGTCELDATEFCGAAHGACSDDESACVSFEGNCHDVPLCPEDGPFCFEPLGRASSKRACSAARRNPCTIDDCTSEK